ncbi:MAG: gliding motility-associated C-terminal domain-containing protein [Chitinophagales bacterium]
MKAFKLSLYITIILFFSIHLLAQKQSNVWFFGKKAGMSFKNGVGEALNNGQQIDTTEGCASVCDSKGNLLFYTNGITIWNNNHQPINTVMPLMGEESATQSVLILPKNSNESSFYIFTTNSNSTTNGLYYTTLHIGSNGNVIIDNLNVLLSSDVTEKITTALHKDNEAIWLITHETANNVFNTYLTKPDGIDLPVESVVGNQHINNIGQMKVSTNGNRLALAMQGNKAYEIFDFNNETGTIANPVLFSIDEFPYGVEFSPDAKKVYGTADNFLYQIDLESESITKVGESPYTLGSLQLAPDNKIYVARDAWVYVGAIHWPNKQGLFCGYENDAVYIGDNSQLCGLGLPNVPPFLLKNPTFSCENTCENLPAYFYLDSASYVDSVIWNFGDTLSLHNVSSDLEPKHSYTSGGTFLVTMASFRNGIAYETQQTIEIAALPKFSFPNDTILCNGERFLLDATAPNATYEWQNASILSQYEVKGSGIYWAMASNNCGQYIDSIKVRYADCNCNTEIPTAFSPNNDGQNDKLQVFYNCPIRNFKLKVYNRWGKKVFQSNDINEVWNGEYDNKKCAAALYVWVLTYEQYINQEYVSQEKKGSTILLR